MVGLDFGATYSGFSYCHINEQDIVTNNQWPGECNDLKVNTALRYGSNFINVEKWGCQVISKRPSRNNRNEMRPVELFKLYLGNLSKNIRPKLPVEYKKAISDYLAEFGKVI